LGLYTREYSNGRVLVNPTWDEATFDLDQEYYTINADDLFDDPLVDIDEDGVLMDSLTFIRISGEVTVGHKGGLILLESLPVDPMIGGSRGPGELFLVSSVPSPFSDIVTIAFHRQSHRPIDDLRVMISDAGGRVVRSLIAPDTRPGRNRVIWDGRDDEGRDLASGPYFCFLQGPRGRSSNSLHLILAR